MAVKSSVKTRDNKHDRILRAAIDTFAEKGFFNSRVSDIAGAAGVADGTIYLYFKNKDDLLIQLFEERMDWFLRQVRERTADIQNPLERLKAICLYQMEVFESDKALAEVVSVELRQSAKFMREYSNRKFSEYLQLLGECVSQAKARGLVRADVSPVVVKKLIFGSLDELAAEWSLTGGKPGVLKRSAGEVLDIIIRGIAAHPEKPG
ncbi:MAG: Fatty acid metabolism regulator protein [Myxococcota bacterium]|nr:Fatty acid metabolism regulator protein [Myxococcota bacterium]